MAEVISNIGAGQTYTTVAAWLAASPSDGTDWTGNLTDAVDYTVEDISGANNGLLTLQADPIVAFDKANPLKAVARIYSAAATSFRCAYTTPFKLLNVKVETGNVAAKCISGGNFVASLITVEGCLTVGGLNGVYSVEAGSSMTVNNSLITDTDTSGIEITVAGGGTNNTVINCNQSNDPNRGGLLTGSGQTWDNTVAYGSGIKDWVTTTATLNNCASGDTTATGTSFVHGIVQADFEDFAGDIYTAKDAGALDGTGTAGADIGIFISLANSIIVTTQNEWSFYSRDLATNSKVVTISGTYSGDIVPTTISARHNGGAITVIDATPIGGAFSGVLNMAVGNGDLEVFYTNDISINSITPNVAVGIKVLVWGQSNYSGRANSAQNYTNRPNYFHKYTVSNDAWQEGADPFDGATANGSLFPIFANLFVAEKDVPVGIVGVAQGSTTLSQWQSGQTLNTRMLDYITNSGGDFEVVSSWIGESDATSGTIESTFKTEYNAVIDQLETLTGTKSLLCGIAQVSAASDNVRQWIQDIVATNPNALGYVDMFAEFQGVHYQTNTETFDVAQALFDGVQSSYYQSTLTVSMAGIPDGDYIVSSMDASTLTPIVNFSGQVTFSSEGTVLTNVDAPIGTRCYAVVRNLNTPSDEADVFTGVTA